MFEASFIGLKTQTQFDPRWQTLSKPSIKNAIFRTDKQTIKALAVTTHH
jgi:hypothetical protein